MTDKELIRKLMRIEHCDYASAEDCLPSLKESKKNCGRSLTRWMMNLQYHWDWFYHEEQKDVARKTARLMKLMGHMGPFKYKCAECGTMVEVKVR